MRLQIENQPVTIVRLSRTNVESLYDQLYATGSGTLRKNACGDSQAFTIIAEEDTVHYAGKVRPKR